MQGDEQVDSPDQNEEGTNMGLRAIRVSEDELVADNDTFRHVKRDWVTLLAPSIIAAILSSISSVAVCSYYIGGMNQRVVNLETTQQHMGDDYMPKAQIQQYMNNQERTNEKNDRTLERISDKLDRLLDKSHK